MDVADLRRSYEWGGLTLEDLASDPFAQFAQWFADALACPEIPEPNAMTLATADASGIVSSRIVLLKGFDSDGFRFFTNYDSRKSRQIGQNPSVALSFYWAPLERQVKILGRCAAVSREDSERYFRSRPRESQLGAWVSPQSEVIPSRDVLETRYRELETEYAGREIPLPPNWGGFCVDASSVEFWQGRPSRLHDRLRYRKSAEGWLIERLAP